MRRNKWAVILAAAFVMSGYVSLFASSSPDGLEKVAETQGFSRLTENSSGGILADYQMPGVKNTALATSLAGMIGTLFIFGALFFLGTSLYRIRSEDRENMS
ncbi:MAG: PDGLE domain-containing protein [Candidatus Moranbacteria bacterium]|nr:PDGLE domain-containing protein [Candidatus Moranbacteria bacterium]